MPYHLCQDMSNELRGFQPYFICFFTCLLCIFFAAKVDLFTSDLFCHHRDYSALCVLFCVADFNIYPCSNIIFNAAVSGQEPCNLVNRHKRLITKQCSHAAAYYSVCKLWVRDMSLPPKFKSENTSERNSSNKENSNKNKFERNADKRRVPPNKVYRA